MPLAYQNIEGNTFSAENIRNCEEHILSIQRSLDKAVADNEYWEKREYTNAYNQIHSVKMRKLYERQKGTCPYCKGQMTQRQIKKTELHVHHMQPRSFGGNEGYSNLRLLHNECHRELHTKFSRNEMSALFENGLDYIKTKLINDWESRVR